MKKPIRKILRTNKNNNFKFPIKFLMTLDKSYMGYLGFFGIDILKSVLMYSKGAICLSRLLFKMGLFTVQYSRNFSFGFFLSLMSLQNNAQRPTKPKLWGGGDCSQKRVETCRNFPLKKAVPRDGYFCRSIFLCLKFSKF
jgi:hypothetical protein